MICSLFSPLLFFYNSKPLSLLLFCLSLYLAQYVFFLFSYLFCLLRILLLFFFFASFLLALWINAKVNKEHFVVYIFNFVHFNANTNNTLTLSYSQKKNVSKHFFGVFQFNTIIHRTQKIWNGNGPQFFLTQRVLHLELQNFNWLGR